MNDNQIKTTQGNKKILHIIEDLRRNRYFIRSLNKLQKYLDENDSEIRESNKEEGVLFDRIMEVQKEIKDIAKMMRKSQSKVNRLATTLITKYAIDPELFNDLAVGRIHSKKELTIGNFYDMCRITDFWDERLNPMFNILPIELDFQKQNEIEVYPIHLEIHRLASKRDVLDFIEKRWEIIDSFLGENRVRIRQRKISRAISDFIWDNRRLGNQEIKRLLDEQFPNNTIVYPEIYQIISGERKRRSSKITVG